MFKRDDWMFGLLSIGVGAVALWAVGDVAGIKTMDPAGPAAMPRIVAWMMVAIGVLHIGGSLMVVKKTAGAETGERKKKNNKPVVVICAASLLYYLLLEHVGYLILTPALILVIMAVVGERNAKKLILASFGSAALLFCVFHFGLGVHLPLGIMEPLFN